MDPEQVDLAAEVEVDKAISLIGSRLEGEDVVAGVEVCRGEPGVRV